MKYVLCACFRFPARMPERHELESVFLANLSRIEKILSALARRHGLSRDEGEEFAAWAKLRVIERDYDILAKFRGESSFATYLTVVLSMLLREYRVREWGRWRPSAAAKRAGQLAIKLEAFLNRDGLPFSVACQMLRTSGETSLSDRELRQVAARFPLRVRFRPVQTGDLSLNVAGAHRADHDVESQEAATESRAAAEALARALEALPSEDQLIVRLHYLESMSVADVARALALPQKPLYRRLVRTLADLRASLERAGVSRDHVREFSAGPR